MRQNSYTHIPRFSLLALIVLTSLLGRIAYAHDYRLDHIKIDHPYATPTKVGSKTAMVFFRAIHNRSGQADKLIEVSTPLSNSAYIYNPKGLVTADIAAKSKNTWRHDQANVPHIMIEDLRQPLRVGQKFPLTLLFKRAGTIKVNVWVQQPKTMSAHQHE